MGCRKCGSQNISQKSRNTGIAYGLFYGGVVLALVGLSLGPGFVVSGLFAAVVGACITERRATCADCNWVWKA